MVFQLISSLGTKFFVLIGSFVISVIIARILGPEGKGIVTSIFVIPNLLVSLADLGVRQATAFFVGKRIYDVSKIYSSILFVWVLTSFLSIVFTIIYYNFFMSDQYSWSLLLIPLFSIPILLLNKYNEGMLLGFQQIVFINAKQIINFLTHFILVFILIVIFNLRIQGAALSIMISGFTAVAFSTLILRKFVKLKKPESKIAFEVIKKGITYAIALFILNLNYKIDIVFLEWFGGPKDIGIYSVGVTLSELIWQVPSAMGMVLFSKSANSKSTQEATNRSTRLLRFSWPPILFCSVILWYTAPIFVSVLYGEEFIYSASVIRILLPGVVAMVVFKILNADLAGRGKPLFALKVYFFSLFINVILNAILIPLLGIIGAAIASSISYSLGAIIFGSLYLKNNNLSARKILFLNKEDKAILGDLLMKIKRKTWRHK